MKRVLLFLPVVLFLSIISIDRAYSAEEKITGLDVMKETREIYQSDDQLSIVTLRLINKQGEERKIVTTRLWKSYKGKNGFDSKTVFFTEFPPDSKGVGFLIWDYSIEGKSDDLWLYLPSLRQVRRISTRDQDDAFMGSDLTFADMGQRRLDEDNHKLLRIEKYNGEPCYVIASTPKDKGSIYSKKITWVSKKNSIILKIDYYDRKGELLKIQTINWQSRNGGYWVWNNTHVKNVQTDHKTFYEISKLRINVGLRDNEFTERALKIGNRRR
ncbi:MAG: outer membrane lipoprotein-sorting protein [Nitrospirota bacterium]